MNDLLSSLQDDGYNEARDRELQRSILSSKYLEKISLMIENEQYSEAMQHLGKLLTALKNPLGAYKNDSSREFASLDYILPLTVQRLTECVYSFANSNENIGIVSGLEKIFEEPEKKEGEKVEKEQPGKISDERFLNVIHTIEDILKEKGLNHEFEEARFYSMVMAGIGGKLIELGKSDNVPHCELNTKMFMMRQFTDQTKADKTCKLIN